MQTHCQGAHKADRQIWEARQDSTKRNHARILQPFGNMKELNSVYSGSLFDDVSGDLLRKYLNNEARKESIPYVYKVQFVHGGPDAGVQKRHRQ